jgi:hypothetical protein
MEWNGAANFPAKPCSHIQWIGLREKMYRKTMENPMIFMGKSMENLYGFRLRFSLKPIH